MNIIWPASVFLVAILAGTSGYFMGWIDGFKQGIKTRRKSP